MQGAQQFLVQPEIQFVSILLIGGVAGWVAEKVTESNLGILNLLVGIAGLLGASALAVALHILAFGFSRTLSAASGGAIVSLVFCHWVAR